MFQGSTLTFDAAYYGIARPAYFTLSYGETPTYIFYNQETYNYQQVILPFYGDGSVDIILSGLGGLINVFDILYIVCPNPSGPSFYKE